MPLPVAHGLCGASIIAATHPDPTTKHYLPIFVGIVLANAADSDFLLVLILQSRDWHRDFTHSIVFSLVVFLVILLALGKRRKREALASGLAYASHGLLDYLTTREGRGVNLLWPFSQDRLGLGWIGLSELPSRLPAIGVINALAMEFLLFTPLFVFIMLSRKYLQKTWAP